MIRVYRIGLSKYARDLTGEGARLFGGRWNQKSIPCIYTSESRSLCLLEYTVNIHIDEIRRALSITTFEIPEPSIKIINEPDLPGNWKQTPAPTETKDFGTRLLNNSSYAVFKIPSIVMPQEFNYILNPLHEDSRYFNIVDIADLVYDVRIKDN